MTYAVFFWSVMVGIPLLIVLVCFLVLGSPTFDSKHRYYRIDENGIVEEWRQGWLSGGWQPRGIEPEVL